MSFLVIDIGNTRLKWGLYAEPAPGAAAWGLVVLAAVVPGVAWIMKTLSRRLYRITKSSQEATDQLAYVVEENVLAILETIPLTKAERSERLERMLDELAKWSGALKTMRG